MSDLRCIRCKHFPKDHNPRGGACQFATHTTERISTPDGIEVIEDVTYCSCPYLLAGA